MLLLDQLTLATHKHVQNLQKIVRKKIFELVQK